MSEEPTNATIRVLIEGRVQGVWYRAWTVEQATLRGLRGWVRNRTDGSVEALLTGPVQVVADMIEACYVGPPAAVVARVRQEPAEDDGEPGFRHLPGA